MENEKRIALSLMLLRIGVFVVMLMWTLDKFFNTAHAAAIYGKFYFIKDLAPTMVYLIGAVELAIIAGFVLGFKKKWTYGAVLVFHGVSTLASYMQYMSPFKSLLFFAAWPMLAACFALFYLRDMDTMGTIEKG